MDGAFIEVVHDVKWYIPLTLNPHYFQLAIYAELGAPNELITSTFDTSTITLIRNLSGGACAVVFVCIVVKAIIEIRRSFKPAGSEDESTYLRQEEGQE